MGGIAFIFSGQGAQRTGMGLSFYSKFPKVKELFDKAEKIRPGTLSQMFEGDGEELKQTQNTQPCLYLADLAPALALTENGIKPAALAGFSLGEIPALAFGGAYSYETGFEIATIRGKLMAEAANKNPAVMAAVLKLENSVVEDLCKKYKNVYPANYNCPGQIVVSGAAGEMASFTEEVKNAGGRVMMLNVSGGFHSHFMALAAEGFSAALEGFETSNPAVPVYSNLTARPYDGDVKSLLVGQITGSVKLEETIKNMTAAGIDTFIECGVGGVLQKLVQKINPGVKAYSLEDALQIETIKTEVSA